MAQTVSATYGTGGNNQPFVVESAGFCTEHSAKAHGIGYEKETAPTLRAGVVPAAISIENHPVNSRIKIIENGVTQTLTARMGIGGGHVPLLMEESPLTLKIRCGGGNGGKGALIQEDKSATLSCNNDQTLFVPSAFGICSRHSNSMMSDNPNSGFYEADTSRTIDTSNQSPCKNQGGMVVLEGNGSRPSHHGDGYKESETMYTLNCTENHAVSYGIGRPAMNQSYKAKFSFQIEEETAPTLVASGAGGVAQPASFYPQMKAESQCFRQDGISNTLVNGTNPGHQNAVVYSTSKNSHHTIAEKEVANTLVATDYKDPPLVNDSTPEIEYIVRRLTPQECALLQGMPTWWCDDLGTENPSEEQIDRWQTIFETFNQAIGKESKPKSRKQIEKWLKNPYSDSAAYKMWGNGIAACNAWFVLAGISYYANK